MKHYDKKKEYHDGLCAVNVGYKEVQTDIIHDPRDGYMIDIVNYGKWGYIDEVGNEVIPIQFDEADNFYKGFAIVKLNGKDICIDKQGQKIRDVIYDTVWYFEDDMAIVRKDMMVGVINTSFEEIIPVMYQDLSRFHEGLASAQLNGKYGFINIKNEFVIEPQFSYAQSFYNSRSVVGKDKRYGCIDLTGKEIIPFQYDLITLKNFGIIQITLKERFIYFDWNGNQLTPDYNYSTEFYNSRFAVVGNGDCGKPWWPLREKVGGKWGVINAKGEEVIPLKFDTYQEAAYEMKILVGS